MKYLGLDTETINGFCRLIGLSNGTHFIIRSYEDIQLFFRRCNNLSFLAFNADYDIQSMMLWLPKPVQLKLIKGIPVHYDGVSYDYISKKYFRFDNNWLYDVHQYYQTSLAVAAEKHLNKKKENVDASRITEANIYKKETISYCINDARLCFELFDKLFQSLPPELKNVKPISTAFYSYKYFKKELVSNRLPRQINRIIQPAYHGGRFEILERGKYGGKDNAGGCEKIFVYDINSAYPYEIMKLRSMVGARYVRTSCYIEDSTYSYFHVQVEIPDKFISPLCYKNKALCIYPVGTVEAVITKNEFKAVREYDPKIFSAVHVFCKAEFPFAEKMAYVYHKKQTEKNPLVWKLVANSLYGKTCQKIRRYTTDTVEDEEILRMYQDEEGIQYSQIEDITNSNFVFASEITANTRLRMYDAIKAFPDSVLAVQTDSLISRSPLPLPVSDKLGDWKLEIWDEAFLVGSGVYFYRIGDTWKAKFRGFNFQGELVENILNNLLKSSEKSIMFETLKRYSIQEANRLHNDEISNQILTVGKKLNINFDRKRVWLGSWESGSELNSKNIKSLAVPIIAG